MELSNLIGKQIYAIYETQVLGTISQALFNKNYTQVIGFYFFDEEENEHFVKTKNIFGFGDFITVKNTDKVSSILPLLDMPSPLRKRVIDVSGNFWGEIANSTIEENGTIKFFATSTGKNITGNQIMSVVDFVLINNNQEKLKSFKPKQSRVLAKSNTIPPINVKIMKIEEKENDIMIMPPKVQFNPDILIGKKVRDDFMGKNNELLLRKNQIVTEKAIQEIKKHNKINQLFHSCY